MSLGQTLINLQDIDLDILRLKKSIDQLPERQRLIKAVKTHKELQQKLNTIVGKRKDIELDIEDIQEQFKDANEKIKQTEDALNSNSDSRLVFNLNRDLAGQIKRKEKLEFSQDGLLEELDKYTQLEEKAQAALQKLIEVEKANTEAIQKHAAQVKEELESLQAERDGEVHHLSDEEYESYELVRERKNGIAVAVLQDGGCSVCGAQFNEGQLHKIKNGEEVSTCPSCSRIFVRPELDEDAEE